MSTVFTKEVGVGLAFVLLTLALEPLLKLMEDKLGAAGTSLFWITGLVFFLTGFIPFRHYVSVLGGGGRTYEDLRASLSEEGTPARIYAAWLERALHRVECFFCDVGLDKQSLPAKLLGLARAAPLWTAPALDRCILLAFIYPQATILLIWMTSGQVGQAERVLGLLPGMVPWRRAAAILAIGVAAFGYWKCYQCARLIGTSTREMAGKAGANAPNWRSLALWFALVMAPGGLAATIVLGHSDRAVGGAIGVTSSIIGAVAGDVFLAFAATFAGAVVGAIAAPKGGIILAASVSCLAGVVVGLSAAAAAASNSAWSRLRGRLRRSGLFLSLFLGAAIATCLAAAYLLSPTEFWPMAGPIILFYGVLSALNAPFLWFSLGLTRTLLWLGLERKGLWPYFYALLDATIAVLTVVVLVAVMVVGVQALDWMVIGDDDHAVLSLIPSGGRIALLDAVQARPAAPQFWWAYALLLSTMIPSMINLTIGGLSLIRGFPLLSRYLYAHMPEGRQVPARDCGWIALILMGQWMIGIVLAALIQVLLLWGIFNYLLPAVGTGLLDVARSVALFDLPAQVMHVFGR